MNPIPKISVVIATHNQAPTLAGALESLLNQDVGFDQFEAIVVDDGSTDQTQEVLRSYADKVVIFSQPHQGLVAACNLGLSQAQGVYFARLDSDDFVDSGWLRREMGLLGRQPEACCVYPDYVEVREDGSQNLRASEEGNLYTLMACGTLFRTEPVRSVGGFRPFYWEEYDLYLRLLNRGTFLHLPEPLYFLRRHSTSMTADAKNRRAGWRELIRAWGIPQLLAAGTSPELEEAIDDPDCRNR
jgi:glycosyltransferase involved in cell wall biosynthesis